MRGLPHRRLTAVLLTAVFLTAVIAVACLALSPARPARADEATFSEQTSTLADYRDRVRRALDVTIAAHDGVPYSASASEDLAIRVDELLPPIEVVLVDGRGVLVDNSMLRSMVESLRAARSPGQRLHLADRMEEHIASLAVAVGTGDGAKIGSDPAALRALLAGRTAPGDEGISKTLSEWIDALLAWIGTQWGNVTSSPGGAFLTELIRWAVIVTLVGLLTFLAYRVFERVRSSLAAADSAVPTVGDIASMTPFEEALPADALAYADDLAGEGDFRDAVRALMRGSVRALRHAGWLYRTRARTTGELLYLLEGAPATIDGPMRGLALEFDRVWYGHRDPGPTGFARAREYYLRLTEALARRGSAHAEPEHADGAELPEAPAGRTSVEAQGGDRP